MYRSVRSKEGLELRLVSVGHARELRSSRGLTPSRTPRARPTMTRRPRPTTTPGTHPCARPTMAPCTRPTASKRQAESKLSDCIKAVGLLPVCIKLSGYVKPRASRPTTRPRVFGYSSVVIDYSATNVKMTPGGSQAQHTKIARRLLHATVNQAKSWFNIFSNII